MIKHGNIFGVVMWSDIYKVSKVIKQPLVAWAIIGLFFAGLQTYVFTSWLLFSDLMPFSTGADGVPFETKVSAWVTQFNVVFLLVLCVLYNVIKSVREGKVAWDFLLVGGGLSAGWLDTVINFFNPLVIYNAYLINWGSWNSFIPGWFSNGGNLTPEPIVFVLGLYGWWFVLFGMVLCATLRVIKRFWPKCNALGMVFSGFLLLAVLDFVLELFFVFPGLYAFNIVIPNLTLWSGKAYQIPIYAPLIIAAICTPIGLLRFQAQQQGYSVIERINPQYKFSVGVHLFLRLLAMVGFVNVVLVTAIVMHWAIGSFGVTTIEFPSYMGIRR
jgi:hypothetical protein